MSDVNLRDYFAGKAIEGMLHRNSIPRNLPDTYEIRCSALLEMAADAYAIADALIAQKSIPVENARPLRHSAVAPISPSPTLGSTLK